MDENQYKEQRMEEEINLRELFLVLWNKKIMIISITLIAAILTGIVCAFVLSPVYHSKLNIVINMPETYHTKYGDYTLPITTNEQYINLITSNDILVRTIENMGYNPDEISIEGLRERISIGAITAKAGAEQNSFEVKVAAGSSSEAKVLAQTLFDNYVEFLDVLTVKGALDFYSNRYKVDLRTLEVSLTRTQEILDKNQALLAETHQTINQKEAMNEIIDSSSTSDYVILENVINPNYTKIDNDIIGNKQSIISIENSMRIYNANLAELDIKKDGIVKYYETGDFGELESDIVSATKTNIYLPSDPVAPSNKTSPSNARNVILGVLVGGMIGVFIALIREYWFREDKNANIN